MIARNWDGAGAGADGDAYADSRERTGIADCRASAGDRGVQVLRREVDPRAAPGGRLGVRQRSY